MRLGRFTCRPRTVALGAAAAAALLLSLPGLAPAAWADDASSIRNVDTTAFPTVRQRDGAV